MWCQYKQSLIWSGVSSSSVLCSCPAGAGVCSAGFPSVYRHLEKLLAASALPRLSPADDLSSGRHQIQNVFLNRRSLDRASCTAEAFFQSYAEG